MVTSAITPRWLIPFALLGSVGRVEAGPPTATPAAPTPDRLLPCTPGLAITYAYYDATGQDRGVRVIERVRGPGRVKGTCVIDQETRHGDGRTQKDAFVREHLADRILYAGWLQTMTAFRPPLLVRPIEVGHRWVFNRTEFRVAEVGTTFDVPAGTFDGCVRVTESSMPAGAHSAWTVYAPGVGVVASEVNGQRRRALVVEVPPGQ